MSFEMEFYELMGNEVTREPFVSIDGFGEPNFGTATVLRAHITHKPVLTRTAAGRSEVDQSVREVVSHAQVYTSNVGWTTKDRITLPDGSQPLIIEVRTHSDQEGSHHQVVMV